jgi:hypothetical protein
VQTPIAACVETGHAWSEWHPCPELRQELRDCAQCEDIEARDLIEAAALPQAGELFLSGSAVSAHCTPVTMLVDQFAVTRTTA